MTNHYDPKTIEPKWQKSWQDEKTYQTDLKSEKEKFYLLSMFPYPSGAGLHCGHALAYTGADVRARFERMNNKEVFFPMGFDAFGIHGENYALQHGRHPHEMMEETCAHFRDQQMIPMGFSYDWSHEVRTYDPKYYKWTQWIFLQMYKNGLAEQKSAPLNYCESCKTVLADEQVEGKDGVNTCERCKNPVEKRLTRQWFFSITKYAEKLHQNLVGLQEGVYGKGVKIRNTQKEQGIDWTEKTKLTQLNWIGRKLGTEIDFKVSGSDQKIKIFTTRVDTIYGVTFLTLAPEHPMVSLLATPEQRSEVEKYVKQSINKSDLDRLAEGKEKTGVFTGAYAINPFTGEKVPVWIGDFVLASFGTGAVMAVPAHDQRDFEFAQKFGIEIRRVIFGEPLYSEDEFNTMLDQASPVAKDIFKTMIDKEQGKLSDNDKKSFNDYCEIKASEKSNTNKNDLAVGFELLFNFLCTKKGFQHKSDYLNIMNEAFIGKGTLYNSGEFSGLTSEEAIKKLTAKAEAEGFGSAKITYRLRDWCISRQRYWGPPVPMIHCEQCGTVPVPEADLPVELPTMEQGWEPQGDGSGPLASVESWVNVACPKCGGAAKRETDVMDNFLDSAWYFLRYPSSDMEDRAFDYDKK